jgi:hypothetical protein
MRNIDEKIIFDKINNLESLPDGYTPNLESKFGLMNAGRYERKKRRGIIWYCSMAAAAAVLLFFAGGYWFKKESLPVPGSATTVNTEVAVKQTKALPANAVAHTDAITSSYKSNSNKRQFPIPQSPITHPQSQQPIAFITDSVQKENTPAVIQELTAPAQPATVTIAATQPAPATKRRYTQVDFNDNISNDKLANKTWSATGSRFKISPFGKDNNAPKTNALQQEEPSLHLKYNF